MIDKSEVRKNLREWLQNPSWKEYFEKSPSDLCKDYIALMFYASETEDEEVFEEMDAMERKLSQEDLKYLYDNAVGPEKARLAKLIQ